jgi:predicted dienelactone hydrolase
MLTAAFRRYPFLVLCICILGVFALLEPPTGAENTKIPDYDPLRLASTQEVRHEDFTVHDPGRNREIPIRIYLPAGAAPAAVVLFSHGLGGTRENCAYLGKHWGARGYIAVFLQHPGSDDSVWKDKPPAERMVAMKRAASIHNFMLRVKDVPVVLDQLELWNRTQGHQLSGRLDLAHVGMSGHSFGAVTTQAVSGESFLGRGAVLTDPRIRAAISLSPNIPRRGDPAQAFGSVKIPWMLMTGTLDMALVGEATPASRLKVFPNLPTGGKYELVLYEAEHSAFTERTLPGDRKQRNPNHHRAILALSTAFWDAYLRGDQAARLWLDGDGPRSVLEPRDRWQRR